MNQTREQEEIPAHALAGRPVAPSTSGARGSRIHEAVLNQCELLLATEVFQAWYADAGLQTGDIVACNNSFLFREGRSTVKSPYYLGMHVTEHVALADPPVIVTVTGRINSQFKRLPAKQLSKYEIAPLMSTLEDQLPRLGPIVFSLAGRIGEPEAAEVQVSGVPGVRALRYEPSQSSPVAVAGDVISLRSIGALDACWRLVQQAAVELTDGDLGAFGDCFEANFLALQEAATRPVDPGDVTGDCPSILSQILDRMETQAKTFADIFAHHLNALDDADVYNELLRIAYNFADGARAFLALMVGVCDLKPVLFWLTVSEQVELAYRFGRLPFSLVGKAKPSLERYRSVIADARNQAFHDLFAFDHPFRVRLPSDALRSPELRLFREYAKRGDSALSFEDRDLVDLLAALTRTAERPVPVGFWEGNKEVMAAVVHMVRALRRALVTAADDDFAKHGMHENQRDQAEAEAERS